MRLTLWLPLALLGTVACSAPSDERASINATATSHDLSSTLQVRAYGASITKVCPAVENTSEMDAPQASMDAGPPSGTPLADDATVPLSPADGALPATPDAGSDVGVDAAFVTTTVGCDGELKTVVRAQSLDVRLELQGRGCAPTLVAFEIHQLAQENIEATYRVFLDNLSPEIEAARGVLAGGLSLVSDIHDQGRTPIGPEKTFSAPRVENQRQIRAFAVCLDHGRRQVEFGALEDLRDTCQLANAEGLCTASGTESSPPLAAAGLLLRLRLRSQMDDAFHFASWGNTGGDLTVQNQIVESVNACSVKPRFAVISGDLSKNGSESGLRTMTRALDSSLEIPWFGTLGDKDVLGNAATNYLYLMGTSSYAMDLGSVRLMVLDSANASLSSQDHDRLDAWLSNVPLWWAGEPVPPSRMLITHFPPFDPIGVRGNAFRSRGEAARLVAALQRAPVEGVITSQWASFAVRNTGSVRYIDSGGATSREDGEAPYWLLVSVDPNCPDESRPTCPGSALGKKCPCISVTPIEIGGENNSLCAAPVGAP